jgi:predicted RND superfamily exporter protein
VVLLILIIMFRSFVYALIGAIPLIITITFNFALMVLCGIPLNMGTALIASVCIGIGVDYSIHFINRYRIEAGRTDDLASTVHVTMETSGRAIFLNAVAVAGGFSVLLFSSFMPVVYLGLLIPLIMATNALAALLIIPAFLNVLFGSRARRNRGPVTSPAQ